MRNLHLEEGEEAALGFDNSSDFLHTAAAAAVAADFQNLADIHSFDCHTEVAAAVDSSSAVGCHIVEP